MRFPKMFAFLLAFVLTSLAALPHAHATTSGGQVVRIKYSAANQITSTAYAELVHSTVRGIKAVSLLNTGSNPIELAFGALGAEVVQTVHPGASTQLVPVVYPLVAGYGTRISAITLDGPNSTAGEMELNLYYN